MLEIVIAKCPLCGQQFHAFEEEEATKKLKEHMCVTTLSDEELSKILKDIVEGK